MIGVSLFSPASSFFESSMVGAVFSSVLLVFVICKGDFFLFFFLFSSLLLDLTLVWTLALQFLGIPST